jgi:NAD(P)-dependent dehydrogenase (short-subunit alcohol dehydrogenase family)
MDYGLAGTVVVITGAGSGIGLATAQAFVTEGASVVAGDLEPGGLAQLAGPGRVTVVTVDLAGAEGPATLVGTTLRVHGRVNAPEDVAAVILFLASDQARQVTGADYTVNAGSTSFV